MGLAGTADRPMTLAPSAEQRAAFERRNPDRPLALLVRYDKVGSDPSFDQQVGSDPSFIVKPIWAGREQQAFIGPVGKFECAALFEFENLRGASEFVDALVPRPGSGRTGLRRLQVDVVTTQPRNIARLSRLLAWLLPKVPFNNAVDETEEPGVGTSTVMPSHAAMKEIKSHPRQDTPVVMINWLKFKPGGGRAAYYRYGKIALTSVHSIGGKLIYTGRFLQTLIGNDGDPGAERWDEMALMQYRGRANFAYMASLVRYRKGLADREAGLAEHGQGLVVTEPLPEFTWRP